MDSASGVWAGGLHPIINNYPTVLLRPLIKRKWWTSTASFLSSALAHMVPLLTLLVLVFGLFKENITGAPGGSFS